MQATPGRWKEAGRSGRVQRSGGKWAGSSGGQALLHLPLCPLPLDRLWPHAATQAPLCPLHPA